MLTALAAATLVACRSAPTPEPDGPATGTRGRRIVVVAPAAAEMLDRLGAIDRVVGIGDFVRRPSRIAHLPRVGDYDTPNVERVLELDADLVVTAAGEAVESSNRLLRDVGIEVLDLDTSTYEGVFRSLRRLGDHLGLGARAAALEDRMREELERIRSRAASVPPRRVLFVVGREPLYVAGPGSHIDQMIRLAGGVNVAGDTPSPYPLISIESVLERMPEVIIDTSDNRPTAFRGRGPGDWERWDFLPAVVDRRVFWVDPELLVIPGVRLPEMTALVGRLIHPELFGEPSDDDFIAGAERSRGADGTEP